MDDWYLSKRRDYELFVQKYTMNGELKMQLTHVEAMFKWTEDEKIAYTPTFFSIIINSRELSCFGFKIFSFRLTCSTNRKINLYTKSV
jgi:hypothetical protein